MLIDINLPKFDIYQGTGATNCFKSHTNSWCPLFFEEKLFSHVRSAIHFVWRNVASTGRSVWVSKKLYSHLRRSHEFSENEQMQIVFTTEKFLDVAAESWPKWGLNPQPLNSIQTLKPTELLDHYIYIINNIINTYINIYIHIGIKKK